MKRKKDLLNLAYSDPRYWGKHVVILGGKIFSTKTGAASSKLLEKLVRKYPEETPLITYIPKAETLILLIL